MNGIIRSCFYTFRRTSHRLHRVLGGCELDRRALPRIVSAQYQKNAEDVPHAVHSDQATAQLVDLRSGVVFEPRLADYGCVDSYESFAINKGLRISRRILRDIAPGGLPLSNETINIISPGFLADPISVGAIGTRKIELQLRCELAAGLSSSSTGPHISGYSPEWQRRRG